MPVFEDFLKKHSAKYGIAQKQTRGILAGAARDLFRERFAGNVSIDSFRQDLVRTIAPRKLDENKPLSTIERKNLIEEAEEIIQDAIKSTEKKETGAKALTGLVHPDGVDEVDTGAPGMAQALKMIFGKTATGRTAPGTTSVNHIHVAGNAQENILFDTSGNEYVVLGVVDGHMDSSMSPSVRKEADKVAGRRTSKGSAERYALEGNSLKKI